MNTELLKKLAEQLDKDIALEESGHHQHFDMDQWMAFYHTSDREEQQRFSYTQDEEMPTLCNTVACLAGTVVLMNPETLPKVLEKETRAWTNKKIWMVPWGEHVQVTAADLLGLNYNQGYNLFHKEQWPNSYQELISDNGWSHARAARALVNDLIEEELYLDEDGTWSRD